MSISKVPKTAQLNSSYTNFFYLPISFLSFPRKRESSFSYSVLCAILSAIFYLNWYYVDILPVSFGAYSFLSRWKTVQPQVRLNLSIFNRPRPVFVNLNSHVFFVPWPMSPKSETVLSKEISDKRASTAKTD